MIAPEQREDVRTYLLATAGLDPGLLVEVALDLLQMDDAQQQEVIKLFAAQYVASLDAQLVEIDTARSQIEAVRTEWDEKAKAVEEAAEVK